MPNRIYITTHPKKGEIRVRDDEENATVLTNVKLRGLSNVDVIKLLRVEDDGSAHPILWYIEQALPTATEHDLPNVYVNGEGYIPLADLNVAFNESVDSIRRQFGLVSTD